MSPVRKRFHSTDGRNFGLLTLSENFFFEQSLLPPFSSQTSETPRSMSSSMHFITRSKCENHGLDFECLRFVEKVSEEADLKISIMINDSTNTKLLVKEIRLAENLDFSKMNLQEEFVLSQLSHKNIIRVLGYQQRRVDADEILTIAFEYVGKTLRDEIDDRKKMRDDATQQELELLARELISALFYLQFRGVFHGNVRPENIFIQEDCSVKIGNFSQAQLIVGDSRANKTLPLPESRNEQISPEDSGNQRAGSFENSPVPAKLKRNSKKKAFSKACSSYWPPEFKKAQEGQRVHFDIYKVDTFSAGVCLLEVATQFHCEEISELLMRDEEEEQEENDVLGKENMFEIVRERYGGGMEKLIREMTAVDEEDRKTTLIISFAPEKEYEQILDLGHVAEFYNLKRVASREQYKTVRRLGEF